MYRRSAITRKEFQMFRRFCTVAAILLPVMAVSAAEPPQVQEGLWQIHTQGIENPGNKKTDFTHKLCRDHAYDKAALAMVKNMKGCTSAIESLGGGKFSADSRCTIGGTAVVSKGIATYQSSTSTHSETHTTYTPAFAGKTDEVLIQDQKYVGSCPANMKPGDQMGDDGTIQHHGQ
jgi:hypothetical protein